MTFSKLKAPKIKLDDISHSDLILKYDICNSEINKINVTKIIKSLDKHKIHPAKMARSFHQQQEHQISKIFT